MSRERRERTRNAAVHVRAVFGDLVWEERRAFLAGVVGVLAVAAAQALQPWPLKMVVDYVVLGREAHGRLGSMAPWLGAHPVAALTLVCVAVLLIGGLRSIGHYVHRMSLAGAAQRIVAAVRSRLFERLVSVTPAARTAHTGDLVSRLTEDVVLLRDVVSNAIVGLTSDLLTLVIIIIVMFFVDAPLTVAVLAVLPLMFVGMAIVSARIRGAARAERRHEGRIARLVVDTLIGIEAVQAFTREQHEEDRFARHGRNSLGENLRIRRLELALGDGNRVLAALGLAVVLVLGVHRALQGHLSAGDLLIFVAYASTAQDSLARVTVAVARSMRAVAAAQRVLEVFGWQERVDEPADPTPVETFRGRIELRDVTFGYRPDRPVLQHVDLVVEPGELVAIIGPPGSGKSTLLDLVMRFVDPWEGAVLIDGHDVRDLGLADLRQGMSAALQDSVMFGATMRDNVAFGRPGATREQVERAARKARAHHFISQLEDGYDTRLGARGTSLSKGQRRRLAIARAYLKRSAILLLDEPGSGLDAETESRIARSIRTLMRGRTTLAITHRPALLETADRIVRLENGRLREVSIGDRTLSDVLGGPRLVAAAPAAGAEDERVDVAGERAHDGPARRAL